MPIKQSAKKALRQSIKHKALNLKYKNKIKDLIKEVRSLVTKNKMKEAKNLMPAIQKALDKAAKTGVIKKNTASRLKSRLTKLLNKAL
ncbi:MAG: 30S ribosomal protein S20 [Candidatus Nealsonbacteria bacterium]